MNKSRLQISKPDIIKFFNSLTVQIHRQKDIANYLAQQRDFWRLAQSTTVRAFIQFLIDSERLTKIVFAFPKPYKRETRYAWGEVSPYQIMLTLKPSCYFSHYTAVKFHGLTEQSPKTVYLNDEQFQNSVSTGELTQKNIDVAFKRNVRVTNYIAETNAFRVCILNGKDTGKLGVVEEDVIGETGTSLGCLRYTNIERTLIDIAVRPVYAGGIHEVLKAYELAQDKLSVNRMSAMLQKLGYIYPYHQVVGFYLDRAGYKPAQLDLLRQFPMTFDFYLVHGVAETEYVKDWRLNIPKDF
jgi:hypothetical protein